MFGNSGALKLGQSPTLYLSLYIYLYSRPLYIYTTCIYASVCQQAVFCRRSGVIFCQPATRPVLVCGQAGPLGRGKIPERRALSAAAPPPPPPLGSNIDSLADIEAHIGAKYRLTTPLSTPSAVLLYFPLFCLHALYPFIFLSSEVTIFTISMCVVND